MVAFRTGDVEENVYREELNYFVSTDQLDRIELPMCKYIVVIPARGGSKRLPRKNILPLAGKPLICYSLEYALCDFRPNDVYVSTDDMEIMQVVEPYGINIIERPVSLSGDLISTADVLQHVSIEVQKKGIAYDYMVLLQCTNPLRPQGMLQHAMNKMLHSNRKSLVGVSPSYKKLGRIEDNRFIPWNYQFGQRSQDMTPLYYENGLIYITHHSLIDECKIIDYNPVPYIIDHPYSQIDIDTIDDFEYAESIIIKSCNDEI